MKTLKLIFSFALLLATNMLYAQTDKATTTKIVTDTAFNFIANTAMPMSNYEINKVFSSMPGAQNGVNINLTGQQYDVRVTKDSIVAFLPYFGRAFTAPVNPTEGGIKFTSKDFSYSKTKNKKGNYTISINTNDVKRENYRLVFSITSNGYASLSVNSMNKQSIFFNGYLAEPKKKEQTP